MKNIQNIWDLKILDVTVTKHRVGENSTFNRDLNREYWFEATFHFNTGSKVELRMVEPRKEYATMDTLEVTYKDKETATEKAFEEYQRVFDLINSDKFLYSRAQNGFGGYCNLYGKDETSPTGVTLMGACSSYHLADYIANLLGKSTSLSPTEDKRTAH